MKFVRAPNLLIAQHWLNLLSAAGIQCELRNRYLSGALGEIPADQCAPELWLANASDEELARQLIEAGAKDPAFDALPWHCGQCGERLEAQFTMCWQCGAAREPRDDTPAH
ncbi:DUF2007 domain-containing protein [Paraburkholderia bonniea]|uniref:putative signal transducing protein n=1 Tax=Paraburkholderia bonniea TaxID=2152891 RepID=UPI001290BED4|nr:DUF2007 domain-containing protein [Paraburkholderia bonniea]WJF91374.1 DUF2007 domain-containing protein [Paraburkholderia bonniea]WJF94691.1 DUF2007 domain-containing protein [Paraburkholderia bonniea]